MKITNVTCAHQTEPLGIDSLPVFSWNCQGFSPTGYKIAIYEESELNVPVFDSGKQITGKTHEIEVCFKQRSKTRYIYQITAYSGDLFTVSDLHWYETGLLYPEDFYADWITAPGCDAPVFVKDFEVNEVVRARIYFSGLGYSDLYINGIRVSASYFTPAWSDYHERNMENLLYPIDDSFSYSVYYLTYDITDLLKSGKNTLEVALGNGFYNQTQRNVEGKLSYGDNKLFLQLEWQDTQGLHCIGSDASFMWYPSPVILNNIYIGEVYDSNKVCRQPQGRAVPVPAFETVMRSQQSPHDVAFEPIVPLLTKKTINDKGYSIYDVGRNISGVVRITTSAAKGETITLRYAEELNGIQELDFITAGGGHIQTDRYIANGEPCQVYSPRFAWHGFRFIEVTGSIDSIEALPVHANVEKTGAFTCDNKVLNWITEAYRQSQLTNLHGGVVSDCPHRERLGYTGDGQLTADTAMLFFNMQTFYTKWYRDILDGQCKNSGHVQHTAPFYGGGGGPGLWGGAIIFLPYKMYLQYGQLSMIANHFDDMARYIRYLLERCEDGILVREADGGWCLGDWCFSRDITPVSEPLVNTYCLIRMCDIMAYFAEQLGRQAETLYYKQLSEYHRKCFHERFYHPETGAYDSGTAGSNAFAVALGFVDEAMPWLLEYYTKRGRFDTGIAATPLLIEQLTVHGHIDLALKLLTAEGYPSFSLMIKRGATALWEDWEGRNSHNHPMFGSVAGFFIKYLLGIRPMESAPGYSSLIINPYIPSDLNQASGYTTTPYGKIAVEWKKLDNSILFDISVPENMNASFETYGRHYPLVPGKQNIEIDMSKT